MKALLKTSLALALFAAFAVPAAKAGPLSNIPCGVRDIRPMCKTPEIDPSLGAGALALLGGMAMVIRSRRS